MKKSAGFTLLELMFTVFIASLLFGVAVPSFKTFVLNNRLATQANTVLSSLKLARSEALTRGRQITTCASDNHQSCTGIWHNGWIVFVDGNGDGHVDAEDKILKVYDALSGSSTLQGNTPVSSRITFNARGRSGAGTLYLCDERGAQYSRGITIAATGRSRIKDATQCS